jgi:tellurite methyltransferase
MKTVITGFQKDSTADWVAELQCGHTQHMRHRPPWQERAWVLDDQERARRLGHEIDCPLCDMPVLPAELSVYKRTAELTEQTIPSGLLKDHTTKAGVWARIVVTHGALEFSFGEPRRSFVLDREHVGIVKPEVPHRVQPLGAVSFHVEFLR